MSHTIVRETSNEAGEKNIKRKILTLKSWHIQWPVSEFNEKILCWSFRLVGGRKQKRREKKRLSEWLRWAVTVSALVWSACTDDEWMWGQLGEERQERRGWGGGGGRLKNIIRAGGGWRRWFTALGVAGSHLDLENLCRDKLFTPYWISTMFSARPSLLTLWVSGALQLMYKTATQIFAFDLLALLPRAVWPLGPLEKLTPLSIWLKFFFFPTVRLLKTNLQSWWMLQDCFLLWEFYVLQLMAFNLFPL